MKTLLACFCLWALPVCHAAVEELPSCNGNPDTEEGSLLQLGRTSAALAAGDSAEARLSSLVCLWRNSTDKFRNNLQKKLLSLDDDTLSALMNGVKVQDDPSDISPKDDAEVTSKVVTSGSTSKVTSSVKVVTKAQKVVKSFKQSINVDLEGGIRGDIMSDQSALDEMSGAFTPCVTTMTQTMAKLKANSMKDASFLAFDSCVTQEKTMKSAVQTCKTTLGELTAKKTEACKLVTNPSESFETMSGCTCSAENGESYPDYLIRQASYFQTLHKTYQTQQMLCEKYTQQLLTQTMECQTKTQELSQKETECLETKAKVCTMDASIGAKSTATCEAYSACHIAAKLSLEDMLNTVKAKQEHRFKEWNSTKSLDCFMDDFNKSGSALCKTVTEQKPCEVPPLPEIVYPIVPEPETCTPIPNPCENDSEEKEPLPEVDEKEPLPDEKEPLPEVDEKEPLPEVDEKEPLPEVDEKEPLPEVDEKEPLPEVDEKEPLPEVDDKEPLPEEPPLPDKPVPVEPTPAPAPDAPIVPQLSCDVACSPSDGAVEIVALPGSTGEGAEAAVPGLTLEECRKLCADDSACEGIEYTEAAGEAPSACKGQRDIHTSKCTPATDRKTEIFGTPWGKCITFGDPHVFSFDRPHGPKMNVFETGEYYLINSSEIVVQGRFGYAKDYPAFASTVGVAVGGPLLEGHNLYVAYIGPDPGWGGFKVLWDGQEILTEMDAEFNSPDGLMSGKLFSVEPTDYHKYARDTIGTWGETLPSYYFTLPGLNLYVLAGYDSANVVMEMQKLSGGQDGICGNFNCDVADDSYDALALRGFMTPLTGTTLFSPGPAATEVQYKKRKGAKTLKSCSHELREEAAKACQAMDEDKEDSCIFDICASGNPDVAKGEVTTDIVGQEVDKDMEAKEEKY